MPFAWVTADSVYGVGAIERTLRGAAKGYVLGVKATQLFNSCGDKPPVAGMAAAIARGLDPGAWRRLSAGAGSKGERLFDWAYCELADLEAAEDNPDTTGLWTRGLLIRGNLADGELAFFSTRCPPAPRSRRWWPSRASAGRSRTPSRPPRPNSGSITTRPAPGTAGTAMSRS